MGVYLDLKKSMQRDLIAFSLLNLTDYQATSFPAISTATLGQTCYRSDLDKLYQLQENVTQLGAEWVEINYDYFFLDFDDHAQIQKLPNNHLVGTKGIALMVDDHMVDMMLLVGVAIFGDSNFNLHDVVVDKLFTRYLPTKRIQIYQQNDGANNGSLIVKNGTEIMPMAKADQRPVQFISVMFATDRTVSLA